MKLHNSMSGTERGISAKQVLALTFTNGCQGVMLTMPFTVAVYMVRSFLQDGQRGSSTIAVDEQLVGQMTGALAAIYSFTQFTTSYAWGVVSNRIGRKPIMIIGTAVSTIGLLWFGLADDFKSAAASRAVAGLLNGIIVAWKCMLGESCDSLTQGRVMSYMSLAWGIGCIAGPTIGGVLSQPCQTWTGLVGCAAAGDHGLSGGLLRARPYFLPCAVAAALSALSLLFNIFLLEETLPAILNSRNKQQQQQQLPHMTKAAAAAAAAAAADSVELWSGLSTQRELSAVRLLPTDSFITGTQNNNSSSRGAKHLGYKPLDTAASGVGSKQLFPTTAAAEEEKEEEEEDGYSFLVAGRNSSSNSHSGWSSLLRWDSALQLLQRDSSSSSARYSRLAYSAEQQQQSSNDHSLELGHISTAAQAQSSAEVPATVAGQLWYNEGDLQQQQQQIISESEDAVLLVRGDDEQQQQWQQDQQSNVQCGHVQHMKSQNEVLLESQQTGDMEAVPGMHLYKPVTAAAAAAVGAEDLIAPTDQDNITCSAQAGLQLLQQQQYDSSVTVNNNNNNNSIKQNFSLLDEDDSRGIKTAAGLEQQQLQQRQQQADVSSSDKAARSSRQCLPWYHQRSVVLALLGYGNTCLLFCALDELTPMFASAPQTQGGLSLEEVQLAGPLAFGGLCLMIISLMAYPPLQRALGTLPLTKIGLLLAAVAAFMIPGTRFAVTVSDSSTVGSLKSPDVSDALGGNAAGHLAAAAAASSKVSVGGRRLLDILGQDVAANDTVENIPLSVDIPQTSSSGDNSSSGADIGLGAWVVLYLAMFFKAAAGCAAFTGSMILVNTLPAADQLGQVNGVGQSLASLARGIGPALGGLLWGAAVNVRIPGAQMLPYALVAVSAGLGLVVYHYIKTPDGEEACRRQQGTSCCQE